MKVLRLWSLPIAIAMLVLVSSLALSQSLVPQDVPTAAAAYKVAQDVLYPVSLPSGEVQGWKIESKSPISATFPAGTCVDYITSQSTVTGGPATVQRSSIEDWSRMQVSETVTFSGVAATVYVGKCGSIVEVGAVVKADPSLSVRKGPATTYIRIGSVANSQQVILQARNTDGSWAYGITATHMGGWMSTAFLEVSKDELAKLPIVEVLSPLPVAKG